MKNTNRVKKVKVTERQIEKEKDRRREMETDRQTDRGRERGGGCGSGVPGVPGPNNANELRD